MKVKQLKGWRRAKSCEKTFQKLLKDSFQV